MAGPGGNIYAGVSVKEGFLEKGAFPLRPEG